MSDAPDPLHASLREFLDAEKSRPDPSPEVQQRTFSRLSTTLGLQVGAGPTASAPQSPPVSPPSTGHVLARLVAHGSRRGLATFLVGAAVGATAYGTVAHLRQESRVERAPAAAIPSPPPEPAPVPPELASEPRPTGEVAPRPAAAPPSTQRVSSEQETGKTKDQGLAAERKWIEMARTALARGRVDGALAALRQHARHYPGGQLAEERDSLLVQSLVAKGDYAQARTQAARFGRQHPNSLFSPVIAQALQSIP